MDEIAADVREGLLAIAVAAGLQAMTADVDASCGAGMTQAGQRQRTTAGSSAVTDVIAFAAAAATGTVLFLLACHRQGIDEVATLRRLVLRPGQCPGLAGALTQWLLRSVTPAAAAASAAALQRVALTEFGYDAAPVGDGPADARLHP